MIKAHLNNDMSIIKISGDDTREYLNNIITNNIEQVNETKSIYSCLLTPQGKFIADFYVASFDNEIIFNSLVALKYCTLLSLHSS